MIAPLLDVIADEFEGKITVGKLNVDENTETAGKYGVRGIPTLLIFKDGEVKDTKVGALSRSQLVEFVEASL
jgi:thioredoxin 1